MVALSVHVSQCYAPVWHYTEVWCQWHRSDIIVDLCRFFCSSLTSPVCDLCVCQPVSQPNGNLCFEFCVEEGTTRSAAVLMLTNIGYHGDKERCLQSWRWWTEGSSHWASNQDMVCLQFRCSHWSGSEVNRWVTWTRFYEAILLWHRLLVLPVFKHTCVFFSVAIKIKPAFLVSVPGFLCRPFF